MNRLACFLSVLLSFPAFCQYVRLEDTDGIPQEVKNGLLILIEDGSCGLCFEKINWIVDRVSKKTDVPVYAVVNLRNLPVERRTAYVNELRRMLRSQEICYLFAGNPDFREQYHLTSEPGSPFIVCLGRKEVPALVLYYSDLFSRKTRAAKIARRIIAFIE